MSTLSRSSVVHEAERLRHSRHEIRTRLWGPRSSNQRTRTGVGSDTSRHCIHLTEMNNIQHVSILPELRLYRTEEIRYSEEGPNLSSLLLFVTIRHIDVFWMKRRKPEHALLIKASVNMINIGRDTSRLLSSDRLLFKPSFGHGQDWNIPLVNKTPSL